MKKEENGRNDYPVRTMLNLIYAMRIFGHRSVESFRRELARNSQLRIVCGLSEGKYKYFGGRKHLIPPARVFTGILKFVEKLSKEEKLYLKRIVLTAKNKYIKKNYNYINFSNVSIDKIDISTDDSIVDEIIKMEEENMESEEKLQK